MGTNDTAYRETETLKKRFNSLAEDVEKHQLKLVISGPLPTLGRGCNSFSRLMALNSWLSEWTKKNNIEFVDNFDLFWGKEDLLKRDGLHPTKKGSTVLSANIERCINSLL